jgi:hypothetical protein
MGYREYRGGRRHEQEPELQWLEDSINMVLSILFTTAFEVVKLGFLFVWNAVRLIAGRR